MTYDLTVPARSATAPGDVTAHAGATNAVTASAVAADGATLSDDRVREVLAAGLGGRFAGQRVLVLIPDHTRTAPLPLLFRLVTEVLADAGRIDVMAAIWLSCCSASVSTLPNTMSGLSSAAFSKIGANWRQGPHQAAQESTRTMPSPLTVCSKSARVSSRVLMTSSVPRR